MYAEGYLKNSRFWDTLPLWRRTYLQSRRTRRQRRVTSLATSRASNTPHEHLSRPTLSTNLNPRSVPTLVQSGQYADVSGDNGCFGHVAGLQDVFFPRFLNCLKCPFYLTLEFLLIVANYQKDGSQRLGPLPTVPVPWPAAPVPGRGTTLFRLSL